MHRVTASLLGLCLFLPALIHATPDSPAKESPAQGINNEPKTAGNDDRLTTDKQVRSRGQLLYENHCRKCHESQVHIRGNHKAKTLADIRGWVTKWQSEEKLGWQTEDIHEVADYLARTFYKFAKD